MSAHCQSSILLRITTLVLLVCSCVEAQFQRPSAAYAPLFTGLIRFTDVPLYGTPEAPPIIQPTGRKRRNDNFPLAPELSTPVLERVYSGVDGSSTRQRRKLQGLQQLSSSELRSSSSGAHALSDALTPSTRAASASAVTEDHTTAPKQGAELQPPTAAPQHSSHTSSSGSSGSKRRRRLQQAAGAKQRPGWTGLWWGDAGGVGVATGPSHAVHTISTVMAVYTLDPATGLQTDTRTVALQDLFAPVGAANCKEGVYDALPLYDKAAKRYIITATCGGKGAVLLAATATSDPLGPWFLFMLLADAAETSMACLSPKETAVAESARLTYDNNGVYISLFNYCPSSPATQGATLLALPKHKVYKGAPNFVYAVFSTDQLLQALPAEQRTGLSASNFKQCAAAPPQHETDAAAAVAYFVCDQAGPDVSPRGNFTLLAIVNTGALWQFVGTRASSPSPFLTARLVDRGLDAPLLSSVLQQQPERGSFLQAGGARPAGFWSGSAVVSAGKVYTVDRIDVTHTPEPPGVPVTLPSLMWTEVAVQVSMTGDCTKTSAWGNNWDWTKDWSIDWGKDFDKEWKENKNDADTMKERVEDLEGAIRKASNCTAASLQRATQQQQTNEVSDGSLATTDGRNSTNCTLPESGRKDPGLPPASGALNTESGGRKLASRMGANLQGTDHGHHQDSSSSSRNDSVNMGSLSISAAWLSAQKAAQCSRAATELLLQPWERAEGTDNTPAWVLQSDPGSGEPSSQHTTPAHAAAGAIGRASRPTAASADVKGAGESLWMAGEAQTEQQLESDVGQQEEAEGEEEEAGLSGPQRQLTQVTIPGFIGFDVGCWYCYYGKGFYYSSSWFYKYWYSRNAWGFGWYRRYKRNYAPGWSRPSKFIGHRRHLLEDQQHPYDMLDQHTEHLQQWNVAGRSSGLRRLMDLQGDVTPAINASQLQNETIMIPPCLLSSTSYKNTCKQCNYSRLGVKLSVGVVRRGFLNRTAGTNPLGFTAPSIAVTPGGVIIITTSYSGPNNHPSSSAPAYPGIGSFTIPAGASGLNGTWKVLRTGVGKVKSPTGRWSDYSTSSASLVSSASPVPGDPDVVTMRLHFGVQWAQREVECAADETEGDFEFEPTCAMPAPWIGVLTMPTA